MTCACSSVTKVVCANARIKTWGSDGFVSRFQPPGGETRCSREPPMRPGRSLSRTRFSQRCDRRERLAVGTEDQSSADAGHRTPRLSLSCSRASLRNPCAAFQRILVSTSVMSAKKYRAIPVQQSVGTSSASMRSRSLNGMCVTSRSEYHSETTTASFANR